jgi:hypothetical protein
MLERFAAQSLVEYDGELIFSKEKFAELIIQECEVALKPPVQVRDVISRGQAYDLIKKHFGVKE